MSVQSNPERRPDGEAQQRTGSGVRLALFAAGLFGASAPFAKLLLRDATPQLLAGLLAVAFGAAWPGASQVGPALLLGFLSYGVSLVLFVLALRHLGTARTGAYFSLAPFVGALVSLGVFRERPTAFLMVGAALMAVGAWLHLTERHEHEHDGAWTRAPA